MVLGTLGRQGNPRILETLQQALAAKGVTPSVVLLSEATPQKLAMIGHVDAWVQVGGGDGGVHDWCMVVHHNFMHGGCLCCMCAGAACMLLR